MSDTDEDCGRWDNGRLARHCEKAGTEFCMFDCPYQQSQSKTAPRGKEPGKMSDELLPCPFCGGKNVTLGTFSHSMPREPTWRVRCADCACESGHFSVGMDAFAAWNRRAQSAEIARLTRERDEAMAIVDAARAVIKAEDDASVLGLHLVAFSEAMKELRAALSPSPGETREGKNHG
jgi:Lar family restriction alleviation protein